MINYILYRIWELFVQKIYSIRLGFLIEFRGLFLTNILFRIMKGILFMKGVLKII